MSAPIKCQDCEHVLNDIANMHSFLLSKGLLQEYLETSPVDRLNKIMSHISRRYHAARKAKGNVKLGTAKRPKFGYDIDVSANYVENPAEQAVLNAAKKMHTEGKTFREIAEILNDGPIRSKMGYDWTYNLVNTILVRSGKIKRVHRVEISKAAVSLITDMRKREVTASRIAQKLNSKLLVAPSGNQWTEKAVRDYLKKAAA